MNSKGSSLPVPNSSHTAKKKYNLVDDIKSKKFVRPKVSQLIRKFSSPDLSEDVPNANTSPSSNLSIIESNIVGSRKRILSPSTQQRGEAKESDVLINSYNQEKYIEAHKKLEDEINKALKDEESDYKKKSSEYIDKTKNISIDDLTNNLNNLSTLSKGTTTENEEVEVSDRTAQNSYDIFSKDFNSFKFDTTPPPELQSKIKPTQTVDSPFRVQTPLSKQQQQSKPVEKEVATYQTPSRLYDSLYETYDTPSPTSRSFDAPSPTTKRLTGLINRANIASSSSSSSSSSASSMINTTDTSQITHTSPKPTQFKVKKVNTEQAYKRSNKDLTQNKLTGDSQKLPDTIVLNQKKYDELQSKIHKINKEIKFLDQLLPPNNVNNDFAQRKKLANAKEQLTDKLEEYEKEKYQIGMLISRAWRKQDGNSVTDFWVRSVSG